MSMTSISHFWFEPSVSALRCLQGHCLFGSCSFLLPFWFNAGLLILPEPKEHCKAVPTCETQTQVKHAYYRRKKLLFQLVFGLRFVASALHLIFHFSKSNPHLHLQSQPHMKTRKTSVFHPFQHRKDGWSEDIHGTPFCSDSESSSLRFFGTFFSSLLAPSFRSRILDSWGFGVERNSWKAPKKGEAICKWDVEVQTVYVCVCIIYHLYLFSEREREREMNIV